MSIESDVSQVESSKPNSVQSISGKVGGSEDPPSVRMTVLRCCPAAGL
jgi:hypothetical protein